MNVFISNEIQMKILYFLDPMEWIQRLHVLIIGPGLGRNEVETVSSIMQNVNLPMIIDADGQGENLNS